MKKANEVNKMIAEKSEKMKQCLKSYTVRLKDERKNIIYCLAVTIIIGLIAHGYMYFNNSVSHDALGEYIRNGGAARWRIQLGRIFSPLYYDTIGTVVTVPWLSGVLSLIYIGLAVFLVTKIFDIKSKFIIAVFAGIMVVNNTVTALTAAYIHDLELDMIGMLAAVTAVFLWVKLKYGFIWGMLPLAVGIGFYQSNISVTITLAVMYVMIEILKGRSSFKAVFTMGLKAIAMLIGGGILYYCFLKLALWITGIKIASGSYNSIDTILHMSIKEIINAAIGAYSNAVYSIINPIAVSPYKIDRALGISVFAVIAIIIFINLFNKKIQWSQKILLVLLMLALPFGTNVSHMLTGGMSHQLMYYAVWFIYLLAILMVYYGLKHIPALPQKIAKVGCTVIAVLIIFTGIKVSNTAYLIRDFEQDANLSLFTRIMAQVEERDDYIKDVTPITFLGDPAALISLPVEFSPYRALTGMESASPISSADLFRYRVYFHHALGIPVVWASEEERSAIKQSDEFAQMPVYPNSGSIDNIDGIIVIKFP